MLLPLLQAWMSLVVNWTLSIPPRRHTWKTTFGKSCKRISASLSFFEIVSKSSTQKTPLMDAHIGTSQRRSKFQPINRGSSQLVLSLQSHACAMLSLKQASMLWGRRRGRTVVTSGLPKRRPQLRGLKIVSFEAATGSIASQRQAVLIYWVQSICRLLLAPMDPCQRRRRQ